MTTNIKWKPFIGDKYHYGINGKKILIIGESHYHNGTTKSIEKVNKSNFTNLVVQEMAIKKNYWSTKFFQNLHRTLKGTDDFNGLTFWNKLSFYNFIQRAMNSNKERPKKLDFIKGWDCFFNVLEDLKPSICLFAGTSSAKYFRRAAKNHPNIEIIQSVKMSKLNGTYPKYYKIRKGLNEIDLFFIKHPSSFYSWRKWRSLLKKYYNKEMCEIDKSENKL
jgi:hypothetical protein